MEELNLAGNKVYKSSIIMNDELVQFRTKIIEFFESKTERNLFKTPINLDNPAIGPGYQFIMNKMGNFYKNTKNVILDRISQKLEKKVGTIDEWILLQTNEEWIDNNIHEHLTSDWVSILYLQTNLGDSISFYDDASNFETLEVNDFDLLIFPHFVKHKPNKNAGDSYRISLNFDIVRETTEEEILLSKSKLDICKECPELSDLMFCNQCKCFMPMKTRIPFTSCPLGKW